jgi:hypothetical protein
MCSSAQAWGGTANDAHTMRLGLPYDGAIGQNQTYIAGIYGTQLTGNAYQVFIDANGQLGTVTGTISVEQLQQQVVEQQQVIDDLSARLAKLEALMARPGRKP